MPTSHERRYAFVRGVGWTNHDAFVGGHRRAQSEIFHQPARKVWERSSRGYALYVNFGPLCRTLSYKELKQDPPVLNRCKQAGNGGWVGIPRWRNQSTPKATWLPRRNSDYLYRFYIPPAILCATWFSDFLVHFELETWVKKLLPSTTRREPSITIGSV